MPPKDGFLLMLLSAVSHEAVRPMLPEDSAFLSDSAFLGLLLTALSAEELRLMEKGSCKTLALWLNLPDELCGGSTDSKLLLVLWL